jgi:agmatinase
MFIVKIPMINGERTEGCERTGDAVLGAMKEIHSNEQGKIIDSSLLDLEEIHLDNNNLGLSNKLIYENSLEIFETKPQVIFLGGDHSITYSIGKAFLNQCNKEKKKPCLIVFDSHADCLASKEFASNRDWLKKLIGDGFPEENILIVGGRNINPEEIKFIKENKIKLISMSHLTEDLNDMCDTIMEFSNGKELYVSIDIDIIDPAFAPATAFPEPGGLSSRQFLYLIQRIRKIRNLRAVDLTEINEKKDKERITVKLGAKILSELL